MEVEGKEEKVYSDMNSFDVLMSGKINVVAETKDDDGKYLRLNITEVLRAMMTLLKELKEGKADASTQTQ